MMMNFAMGVPGLMMLIVLLFYAFILYCLVTALQFMKKKLELDTERNQKLDQLIQAMHNQKGKDV